MTTFEISAGIAEVWDQQNRIPIQLLAGDWGSGKSWLCLHHPLRAEGLFFDLEKRYGDMLKFWPLVDPDQVLDVLQMTKEYQDDSVGTWKALKRFIRERAFEHEGRLIVVDGVTEMRNYAKDSWCVEKSRKKPMNPGDWGEINDKVRKAIFPLFNFAKLKGKCLVVTSLIEDEYDNGEATGRKKISAKNWLLARCDSVVVVKLRKTEFFARRRKDPRGPTDYFEVTSEEAHA